MKAVIFDLDGTLIDTAPDIVAAANRMLRGIGLSDLPFDTVRSFIGDGVPRLVDRVMKAHDIKGLDRHSDLVQSFLQHYNAALAQHSSPYPNLVRNRVKFRMYMENPEVYGDNIAAIRQAAEGALATLA